MEAAEEMGYQARELFEEILEFKGDAIKSEDKTNHSVSLERENSLNDIFESTLSPQNNKKIIFN